MAGPRLQVEDRGRVRVLTLANPDKRNALDLGLLGALREALARAGDEDARCIVVRGEGERAFCAGMDFGAVEARRGAESRLTDALEATMQAVEAGPPVVAFLNGAAYGAGFELACACDLRVAADGIELCIPPARLGLVYGADGVARIASVVGLARARRMLLTAAPVEAKVALEWGLVDEVLPRRMALGRALELAEQIAGNAPQALRGTKRVLAHLAGVRLDARDREEITRLQRRAFASDDAREALLAFRERRKPRFTGK